MVESIFHQFNDMRQLLSRLDKTVYSSEVELIGSATIGKHFRHLLEFYQTVINNSDSVICYDARKRDERIEKDPGFAIQCIEQLEQKLQTVKSDHPVFVTANYRNESMEHVHLSSSVYRELAYALDHAIHHLAIIKIAVKLMSPDLEIDNTLGVAPSTLRFRSTNQTAAE